ncbi:hypothetical protein HGRIS_000956 [Hohenbuehelia grisea]|uniref:Effector protein n=1 Tax=Hohenbuehelia grisea TaxID=104357 RepID=A0ABR3IQ95_9AGAR
MANSLFFSVLLAFAGVAVALPGHEGRDVQSQAAPDNIVLIASTEKYCMVLPRTPHTNIGDSEHPGGMKTYCTSSAKYSRNQGDLPGDFWSQVELKSGLGRNGAEYKQLTGCIRPERVSALNAGDGGGQYDSSGGREGRGNPEGSKCLGYNHYIEIVEPSGPRACLKCCNDPADCPTNRDTQGCPAVIPGNYFHCA